MTCRRLARIAAVAAMTASSMLAPVAIGSASATPSCAGQEFSAFAKEFGAGLGAAVSFEARNPELEGRKSFGEEVRELATADPSACPAE
jgi:hypothetical protein